MSSVIVLLHFFFLKRRLFMYIPKPNKKRLFLSTLQHKGTFDTLKKNYIRNSNLYYKNRRYCTRITITIHKFDCYI